MTMFGRDRNGRLSPGCRSVGETAHKVRPFETPERIHNRWGSHNTVVCGIDHLGVGRARWDRQPFTSDSVSQTVFE